MCEDKHSAGQAAVHAPGHPQAPAEQHDARMGSLARASSWTALAAFPKTDSPDSCLSKAGRANRILGQSSVSKIRTDIVPYEDLQPTSV
jgi:hypothetical protein